MKVFLTSLFLLMVVPAWGQQINLTWTDRSDSELGFEIERGPDSIGPFIQIGIVGVDIATFTDATVMSNMLYCYRVRAWNNRVLNGQTEKQFSDYSNIACGSTVPKPEPPTNLLLSQAQTVLGQMDILLSDATSLLTIKPSRVKAALIRLASVDQKLTTVQSLITQAQKQ